MNRVKSWHQTLIFAVFALIIYNILPTLIFYCKPLKQTVSQEMGMDVAKSVIERLQDLENHSLEWTRSYCKLLHIDPLSIELDKKNPQIITVHCAKREEAERLKRMILRAGSLIPFVPAQLTPLRDDTMEKSVSILRRVPSLSINPDQLHHAFSYTKKSKENNSFYSDLIRDRAITIGKEANRPSETGELFQSILASPSTEPPESQLLLFAQKINEQADLFRGLENIEERFCTFAIQHLPVEPSAALDHVQKALDTMRDRLKIKRAALEKDPSNEETLSLLKEKESNLTLARLYLKNHRAAFLQSKKTEKEPSLDAALKSFLYDKHPLQSPFFSELIVDAKQEQISLKLHPDLASLLSTWGKERADQLDQWIINELARIAQKTNESFSPQKDLYSTAFHTLPDAKSFLIFDLDTALDSQIHQTINYLKEHWHPKHPDLVREHFPIVDAKGYAKLPEWQKKLCLCVFAKNSNAPFEEEKCSGGSLYILARGLDRIIEQAKLSQTDNVQILDRDFSTLSDYLHSNGFFGSHIHLSSPEFRGDALFEHPRSFGNLLAATREDFQTRGSLRYAILEFADLEQRIIAENRIDTKIHEDLLKWRDDYSNAQAMGAPRLFDVPKPTHNAFWNNLILSWKKYFRGDEKKVLRWGLDLSGGKSVQIALRDQKNAMISEESDIKQGMNELFHRVNKMGVSEVSIRQLGQHIVLDFPGSQALRATELIQGSSMYFHVVNEKFASNHRDLKEASETFLQEIWNQALLSKKTDPLSINILAYKQLYGENTNGEQFAPRSPAARTLLEHGLRLQDPNEPTSSNEFDDSLSKVAILRSENNQTTQRAAPLLIVFANHALEGSQLSNIRSSYDPSKGNYLSFDVQGTSLNIKENKKNPRAQFYRWTSEYSKDNITGTTKENYSNGQGWRMAVLLNESVINAPTLHSPLKESAMISGSFTQTEVTQLVSDLKAGALSFTPQILSEKNVSPELGKTDRIKGITATCFAFLLVVIAMIAYYRFAGLIASAAVFVNLLILWATLQNLQATLSLAGIAGIILTVGMAVDANVLVFERIKEELAQGKKLSSAIAEGYQKALIAIVDSNVTTLIAGLILLHFDAGPIKGFAITLIIGIASSMFTALFMTRVYFNRWLAKKKDRVLHMADWIKSTSFNFLGWSKFAALTSLALILIGGTLFTLHRTTLFGMDFKGGYSLEFEVEPLNNDLSLRELVSNAFERQGASSQQFEVRELSATQLRVLFSTELEKKAQEVSSTPNSDMHNAPIRWILQALNQDGISLTEESLKEIDKNWTAISGQMSDTMRNNALIGLAIAFGCIFVYLAVRFEAAYATSALACLLHDVCATIGAIGLLHFFGLTIQIDLNTIAAIMTIIGYSLNDTIIIFDRIREEGMARKNSPLTDRINQSLNATLSRTSITSATTLLVLIALVCLGGSSIFNFSLVMTLGVLIGTFSSWFIASPLLLLFSQHSSPFEAHLVKKKL